MNGRGLSSFFLVGAFLLFLSYFFLICFLLLYYSEREMSRDGQIDI